jgi:hypothetical protein
MKIHFHHILPCAKAPRHGIWDFADRLALHLEKHHGATSDFSSWCARAGKAWVLNEQALHETEERIAAADPSVRPVILFHFDYGSYGWNDLPFWLYSTLSRLRKKHPRLGLMIFCHEIPPPRPRKRTEWVLLPFSRLLVALTFRLADRVLTSNPAARAQFQRRWLFPVAAECGPIFSNIGEPSDRAFLKRRTGPAWVIFGSAGNLPRYLESLRCEAASLPAEIAPAVVNVIGGGDSKLVKPGIEQLRRLPLEVRHFPDLDEDSCSEIFRQSSYLYLRYFETDRPILPAQILKSGVFAAANAHGVVTIVDHEGMESLHDDAGHPGLVSKRAGRWSVPANLTALPDLLMDWYQQNSSLERMSQLIMQRL